MLPLHSVDMHLLVSDRELPFSSQRIFHAGETDQQPAGEDGGALCHRRRSHHRKPLHVLQPKDSESMTMPLKHATAQKRYFELGLRDADALLARG
jgi:hypothetical protein